MGYGNLLGHEEQTSLSHKK